MLTPSDPRTQESQTPDVITDDVPMEIESDTVPVATTSDSPETQQVEMPVRDLR